MRIRFLHSVQTIDGHSFAKGDVVEASDVPGKYRTVWLASGSAVEELAPFESPETTIAPDEV